MGSSIWFLQPWFNFYFYYSIPLILYFFHKFFDSGKWRYFFLAGNLLFLQSIGNIPYFLPVTALIVFLYYFFYSIFNYHNILQKIKNINFGWPFVATTCFIVLLFVLLYKALLVGVDQIVNYNFQRNLDGSATLDVFLNYGGEFVWQAWLELFLGVSPCLDYTLYVGLICVPFILLGLILNLNRENIHFLLIVIVLFFFSMGSLVSVFFYFYWPMMNFFRHLMAVSPIITMLLCFLAGFGFDAVFFNNSRWKNPLIVQTSLAVMSIFMLGVSIFLWFLSNNSGLSHNLVESMVPEYLPRFMVLFKKEFLSFLLSRTTIFASAAAFLFVVLYFINIRPVRKDIYIFPVLILFLVLHCTDLYGFKFFETNLKTVPLNDKMHELTEFQNIPYPKRRDLFFLDNSPRGELLKILPVRIPGTIHWTTLPFLFKDQLDSPFRTSYWLLPLDNYMRAYWGQSIHDLSTKPHGLYYHPSGSELPRLDFPKWHPAALKISGATEDKIQFFSQVYFIPSDDVIASKITSTDYKGDTIFLSPLTNKQKPDTGKLSDLSDKDFAADKRLHLSYQVQRFDSNNLVVTVENRDSESAWMFYSDVWHPLWRATVNGKETPVYKANLAYKAVRIEQGLNKVHLYFKSGFMSFFHYIVGVNSFFWLVVILFLAGGIVFNHHRESTHSNNSN